MTASALHIVCVCGGGAAAISGADVSRECQVLLGGSDWRPQDKKQAPDPREEAGASWPTAGDQLQGQAQHASGPLHRLFPSPSTVPLTFIRLAFLLANHHLETLRTFHLNRPLVLCLSLSLGHSG